VTTTRLQLLPHAVTVTLLLALALWLPLPLYLVSLALFGLPHIIWELGFLRSRYAARWPTQWWIALWVVLLLQALARGAVWLGTYPAESSRIVDILALFLLGLIVLFAPMRVGWLVRIAGMALAGAIMWLLEQGDLAGALLVLAISHNFTPLAMAWDMARDHRPARRLAWTITGLLMLPLLVAASGWEGGMLPAAFASHAWTLDGQIPTSVGGSHRQAVMSAVVLAQCIHYYCVIILLPRAEARRIDAAVIPVRIYPVFFLAALLLLAYFLHDYASARQFYSVAAGVHAWLEWPVLLMALLSAGSRTSAYPLPIASNRQAL
jgi:hypothetical protein